jgi:hypothetical protein
MRRVELPVSRLSLAQKLDLMETLWADLSQDEKKLDVLPQMELDIPRSSVSE